MPGGAQRNSKLQAVRAMCDTHGLRIVEDCARTMGAKWELPDLRTRLSLILADCELIGDIAAVAAKSAAEQSGH